MHITSPNPWGLPQAEGHSAPRAAYRDFVRTGPEAAKLGFRAIINREFDSLSLTERVTLTVGTFGLELLAKDQPSDDVRRQILGFKDQPEFINRLRSPRLEDLPYYDDVIKAAAEAIEAYDQLKRGLAKSSRGPW
ncbi:hypothetical protein LX32DRAFT_635237 [Colletotrichum zoysiae]|uniref:Uncharacterized protein n=1 Tax=Colletotrichum zoysiae TaxID=1216348 RepID=A0AAD9HTE7_9PEZI|nr:hypothetical protein LX32DRAFT_635237 [Colletotrichum zoysiae]